MTTPRRLVGLETRRTVVSEMRRRVCPPLCQACRAVWRSAPGYVARSRTPEGRLLGRPENTAGYSGGTVKLSIPIIIHTERYGGTAARRHSGTAARRHGGTAVRRYIGPYAADCSDDFGMVKASLDRVAFFCTLKWTWFVASDVTGALAGFSTDLDDGHIPARRTTNCVF